MGPKSQGESWDGWSLGGSSRGSGGLPPLCASQGSMGGTCPYGLCVGCHGGRLLLWAGLLRHAAVAWEPHATPCASHRRAGKGCGAGTASVWKACSIKHKSRAQSPACSSSLPPSHAQIWGARVVLCAATTALHFLAGTKPH